MPAPERKATKCNTPAQILHSPPFFLLFCQFVVTGGDCSLLVFFYFYTSPSALLCLFCLSYELSICCLVEGAELFSSLSPLLPLLDKVYSEKSERLLDGTQAAFLSPDLSVHLPLSPSFFLHFWPLSHTPPFSSIHLISSEDEDW